jgi:hypothetical protein
MRLLSAIATSKQERHRQKNGGESKQNETNDSKSKD